MEIKHVKTILAAGILIAYIAILLKLIVFKYSPGMVFDVTSDYYGNYLPFKTILSYLSGEPTWAIAIRNLAGNIFPFIPLGLIAPFLYRPLTWKQVFIVALAFGFLIEIVQVVLRTGIFDVDDILLNTLGAVIGYVLFVAGENLFFAKK
jgi:glycopeptide antibiotics resistance protein